MANNIQSLLTALTTARNSIRTKLVALGLVQSSAKLSDCATAIDTIDNQGAVSAQVKEGESYTIPKGYHNGSGTVQGVSGGGNYATQAKTVTPTKKQQQVTPDAGYYALSGVTVNAIPDNYNDTSAVTAAAGDVLANKTIVGADGTTIAGTMANNSDHATILSSSKTSYTIPAGKHSGNGIVKINIDTSGNTFTPTASQQSFSAPTDKVWTSININAADIPTYETWTITYADGSTSTKKVGVSNL